MTVDHEGAARVVYALLTVLGVLWAALRWLVTPRIRQTIDDRLGERLRPIEKKLDTLATTVAENTPTAKAVSDLAENVRLLDLCSREQGEAIAEIRGGIGMLLDRVPAKRPRRGT